MMIAAAAQEETATDAAFEPLVRETLVGAPYPAGVYESFHAEASEVVAIEKSIRQSRRVQRPATRVRRL